MTDSRKPEHAAGPHPYFMAIEEIFLELRGAPLQLSPKDWQVAKGWHQEGIPLDLVETTLREIFERRKAREADDRVWTLGLCKRSVAAAWRERQKLEATAQSTASDRIDPSVRLSRLANALPDSLARREEFAKRIRELSGEPAGIEEKLVELDQELLASAKDGLDASQRADLEREITAATKTLARRLPDDELAKAKDRVRDELIRGHLGIPVLSLFAPEALAPDS